MTASPRSFAAPRCNIGPAELARRRRIALALTFLTAVAAVGLVTAGGPHSTRALLWPLAAASAVTWLQVVRRFCVRFGAGGLENFGALGGETPVDPAIRAADRRRAATMIAEGGLIGLAATLLLVGLPI